MSDLSISDFGPFFSDVHGVEPFPWQTRLTEQVLSTGAWPQIIALPTGTGKTSTLDTAIFSLAARPDLFPRRVVFVVDRRIIVDQVYERAWHLRARLESGSTETLRRVRDRLVQVAGSRPLSVSMLRGGIPIDNEWTHRPDQPWIVVSTVDQFGSRLLFRGYGVSPRMHPIHAGLAGSDCLVILDEVHLSRAFAGTLRDIARIPAGRLPRRYFAVEMSATPPDEAAEPFALTEEDLARSGVLRQRVEARKAATTRRVGTARQRAYEAIPPAVLEILRDGATEAKSVGVIVNRVRTAREVFRQVSEAGYAADLITGRMRPIDRAAKLASIQDAIDPDRGPASRTRVIVATQAIEVGADFSFDSLITECAPIESLQQRFGRLDRRGTTEQRSGTPASASILGVVGDVEGKQPDPIYGESLRATWLELQARFADRPFDVGPRSADLAGFPSTASAPTTTAPLLLPTHLDAWVQTHPRPIIEPEIEPFLHGMEAEPDTDVMIAWRWDRTSETLRLVPPRPAECLPVPISAARAWLADGSETQVADVDASTTAEPVEAEGDSVGRWVQWNGPTEGAVSTSINSIQPGATLVVDPTLGGISFGSWDPHSTEAVDDLGDVAQLEYGKRRTLRLDPRIFPDAPRSPDETVPSTLRQTIEYWMKQETTRPSWVVEVVSSLQAGGFSIDVVGEGDAEYPILTERTKGRPSVDASILDGSDEAGSFTGAGVSLAEHSDGVGDRAAQFADRLGLAADICADLRLAGRLHDLGKVDPRFQEQLVGGDPVELEMRKGHPLAKSLPDARRVNSYPSGMRHEMMSVALIESHPAVLSAAHDPDLVVHLVATHHGFARPLAPIRPDPQPQNVAYEFDGQQMTATSDLVGSDIAIEGADRFWRLIGTYGHHGLAWLEAILRLADHRQSEQEVG